MPKTIHRNIGNQLRQLREAAELTQTELAERAGLSQQHVSSLERDLLRPEIETLSRLCYALQVDFVYDGTGIVFRRRRKHGLSRGGKAVKVRRLADTL